MTVRRAALGAAWTFSVTGVALRSGKLIRDYGDSSDMRTAVLLAIVKAVWSW
jgi:hypothetical protein